MVSVRAPATTTALLRKYRPMCASFQARAQLSKRARDGRPQASERISSSLLNELSTAHSSGNVVSRAQPARKTCEKVLPMRATAAPSELDPLAPGQAQRGDRDGQGDEEHRDADG